MSCLVCSDLSKSFIRIVSNFIGKNSSGTIKFRAIPFELHNIQFHNAVFFGNNIVYSQGGCNKRVGWNFSSNLISG